MTADALSGKKIIVGVTGGIAAYKSCLIIRELVSRGAEVRVVMTPSALQFITPLTLSSLSGSNVIVNTFPPQNSGVEHTTWHIDYTVWADLMLIAPATINTIAKINFGFADNALTTVAAALRCPLIICPAADTDMYSSKQNIANINDLKEKGVYFVDPESGFLASGLSGAGRLADINKIVDAAELILSGFNNDLKGKRILVTAGPTYEDIDPVRFIGNRSSGKMGFELAKAAFLRGAGVTLISGPSAQTIYQGINLVNVRSAADMQRAVEKSIDENDVLIMSAAVADYKPSAVSGRKIKKSDNLKSIDLIETSDILRSIDKKNKKIIGFALETDNELENASAKLKSKNLDMIVLNSLNVEGAAFETDSNKVTIIPGSGEKKDFPLASKFQTANFILSEILKLF